MNTVIPLLAALIGAILGYFLGRKAGILGTGTWNDEEYVEYSSSASQLRGYQKKRRLHVAYKVPSATAAAEIIHWLETADNTDSRKQVVKWIEKIIIQLANDPNIDNPARLKMLKALRDEFTQTGYTVVDGKTWTLGLYSDSQKNGQTKKWLFEVHRFKDSTES